MPRILFVDDDAMVLRSLSRTFGFEYDLSVAYSADEAQALLSGPRDFDVVVTDVRMPDCDGLTFIREAAPKHPETRFIILTGHPGEHTLELVTAMPQVTNVLEKPATRATLLEAINKATATSMPVISPGVNAGSAPL